jgi:hypothetical protein
MHTNVRYRERHRILDDDRERFVTSRALRPKIASSKRLRKNDTGTSTFHRARTAGTSRFQVTRGVEQATRVSRWRGRC